MNEIPKGGGDYSAPRPDRPAETVEKRKPDEPVKDKKRREPKVRDPQFLEDIEDVVDIGQESDEIKPAYGPKGEADE